MRLLEAGGSPYEIGYAIGSQAPELVARAVELVCRIELAPNELRRRLRTIERRLDATFPNALAEAEGLAEGAVISRQDALALSVASDLHGKLPGWCSLGAVPGADGLLVGKNLDTHEELAPVQVLERLEPEDGYAFVHVTTAGAMWTDGGLNAAGLALVNSSLAASSADPSGVPDGVLAREALARCADVPAAIELVSAYEVMTLGENIIVADSAGRAALIEKLPGAQNVRSGDSLVACNHPLAEPLAALMSATDPIRGNSERRLARLNTATGLRATWARDDLESMLADHEGGVCQHGDEDLWTIASIVLAPTARRMWLADGPPCETAYEEITAALGPGKEVHRVHGEG